MESIAERLQEICNDLGGNNKRFEEGLGVASGYIAKLRRQNSSPSTNFVKTLVANYPEYSLEWIITGEGQKKKGVLLAEGGATYTKSGGSIDEIVDRRIKSSMNKFSKAMKEMVLELIDDEIRNTDKKEENKR